jgi:hypothetical protein
MLRRAERGEPVDAGDGWPPEHRIRMRV